MVTWCNQLEGLNRLNQGRGAMAIAGAARLGSGTRPARDLSESDTARPARDLSESGDLKA